MHKPVKPFVPSSTIIPELTPIPLIMGVLLGIVFGASSLYLALKVGMTVSASIPVAVLSVTLFRAISKVTGARRTTILENNIVQTAGSAGESIAFGVAVTMPALLILGFNMELSRIMLVAVLGGLLGVLMMIPLRHALVVKKHGELPFPEGTACAEVLIVGEKGGTSAFTVMGGFLVGLFYKFFHLGTKLWVETPMKALNFFKGAMVGAEVSPELLGVGYIIGPRIASIMVGGGILAAWVLVPAITLFGQGLTMPVFPATKLISNMSPYEINRAYVLYIGAGAVAAGGIISLFQNLPTIFRTIIVGLKGIRGNDDDAPNLTERTERDLPMSLVLFGALALVALIWLAPALKMNLLGAVMMVFFGFLFVTVSARLTGEIGSSSNPISGMTVATLLITSVVFLALGWVSPEFRVAALSVAAVVCVAASNGGTTAQDLKTGHLVGATPRAQQIAILIGALTSALVIGVILKMLNDSYTVYSKKDLPAAIVHVNELTEKEKVGGPEAAQDANEYHVLHVTNENAVGDLAGVPPGKYLIDDFGRFTYLVDPGINGVLTARDDGTPVQRFDAPKARLMSLIIDGILTQKLPWGLVLLGVAIAIVLELCGVASLPFAVGVYLPIFVSMPIFVGGMIRWVVDKLAGKTLSPEESESSPGILFSSGLIAGGAICGILLALLAAKGNWGAAVDLSTKFPFSENHFFAMLMFGGLCALLFFVGRVKAPQK